MLLKLGSQGPDVVSLTNDLRSLGFALASGNFFDLTVKRSVEAFQIANVDASGTPLIVDGKVGDHTQWALNAALHGLQPTVTDFGLPPLPAMGGSAAGRAAIGVALAELSAGHGETLGDNLGPDITRYLTGSGEAPPASWCAAFVSYCFRSALGHNAVFGYTAGAREVHNRMRNLGYDYQASMSNPPQTGDLIVWRRVDPKNPGSTAYRGHVGIVHSYSAGNLWTVEGNRGPFPSKVKSFRYSWVQLVGSASNDKFKGLYGLSRHP
jgi:hypothetical protein